MAIKSLGFGTEQMTSHGFYSMASTILNEAGLWKSDPIVRQLVYVPGDDEIRPLHNHDQYLPETYQNDAVVYGLFGWAEN